MRADIVVVALWLCNDEADSLSLYYDVSRALRCETRQEAFAGTNGIEPANALQALAHGRNAKRHQRLCIFRLRPRKTDVHQIAQLLLRFPK